MQARRGRLRSVREPGDDRPHRRQRADADRREGHGRGRAGQPTKRAGADRREVTTSRAAADLVAFRPIIESAASGIVSSRAFTGLFRAAVRDVHRAVFDRDRDTVTLTVADVGTLLAAALEQVRPSLARRLEATERVALLSRDIGSVGGDLARLADRIRVLAIVLLALSLILAAGALALSNDRRRTVVELGDRRRRGRGAPGGRVCRRPLARDRPARRPGEPGRGRRGLGRVPRRPAHSGVDRRRLRRRGRRRGRLDHQAGRRPRPARPRPPPGGRPARRRAAASGAPGAARGRPRGGRSARPGGARGGAPAAPDGCRRLPDLRGSHRGAQAGLPAPRGRRGPPAGRQPRPLARPPARDGAARGGADRRRRHDLRRHGRRHDRRAGAGSLQRSRRAVRTRAGRSRAPGDPQRDVGARARQVLVTAGPPDRGSARRRDSRPPDRHPLRRPAAERQAAHPFRESRGAAPAGRAGRAEPGRRGRRHPHPGAGGVRRRGRARHVPLPHLLRARRHSRWSRCSTTCATSSSPIRTRCSSSSTRTT